MNNKYNALYFSPIQAPSQSLIRQKTAGATAESSEAGEDACTEWGSSETHVSISSDARREPLSSRLPDTCQGQRSTSMRLDRGSRRGPRGACQRWLG